MSIVLEKNITLLSFSLIAENSVISLWVYVENKQSVPMNGLCVS